jgi:hypothetical protein
VAHKGFPVAKEVVDIMVEICKLRNKEDLRKGLTVWQQTDFLTYIRGKNNSLLYLFI